MTHSPLEHRADRPRPLPVATLGIALLLLPMSTAAAATLYVDQASGDDSQSGASPEQAVASLARGAELLQAGDQLIVGPGTYYEQPVFSGHGGQVWIRAEPMGEATISGMWEQAAEGLVGWRDEGDGSWSAPHGQAVFGAYEDAFLFRFETVDDLLAARAGSIHTPGWGFAHEDGRIYLVLPGGEDPNGRPVKLSSAYWGEDGQLDAVVWIHDAPEAILEGFRVEGAGTLGVWIETDSPGPTVRNTVFSYCVYGLALPQRSLVEWVEYSYPGFYDFAEEVLQLNGDIDRVYSLVKEYHDTVVLEGGLALGHGWTGDTIEDCEFRYNFLHEAFDGEKLGFFDASSSHHNAYLYNYDNHVELEGWYGNPGADLHLHHNLMLACPMGPISHQGDDIVGPQYVYNNVVWELDTDHGHTWTQLKTDAPNATGGLHYFHNLFWAGHTTMFWEDADKLWLRNNILVFTDEYSDEPASFDSDYNLLVNIADEPWLRGASGYWVGDDPGDLELQDPASLDFRPTKDSPGLNLGIEIPGFNEADPDIGPFELGQGWDGDWPRPMETVFDCSVPERWQGEDPDLACDDEEGDTGLDSASPGDCEAPHDSDGPGDSQAPSDSGDSPDSGGPRDSGVATDDETGCGCSARRARSLLATGLTLAALGCCAGAARRRGRRHG